MPQLFSPAPATPSPKRASPMRVLATKVKTEVVEVSHRIRKLSLHVPKRRRRESQASSSSFSSSMTSSSTSSNSSAMAAAIISSSTIISTPIFPFVEIITTPTQTAPQTPKAVRGLSEKVVFPAHEDHEVKEVDFAYVRRKRASQESALSSSPSFASARSVTQSGTPLEAEVAPAVDVVEPIREEVPTEVLTEDVPVREDDLSLVPPPPPMTTPNSPPAESPAASQTLEQPSVYVEPPVPDPFLIDDGSSSGSEKEQPREVVVSDSQITAALDLPQEISLTQSLPTSPVPLPPADISKPVPPPPPSSGSDPEESEAPELYLPGLVIPTMFLPIPNTDPLTTLLTKYIYPPEKRPTRDVNGEWHHSDFHTLVMTNSWRALARMARDRLVTSDPEDLNLVLSLWYLRLACLARLRLFNQTAAECTTLFAVLNAVEPPESKSWLFERLLPFELEVMHARLKYWSGDHMGYLDALYALMKKCKFKAREAKSDVVLVSMWKERGARVCLILASQLIEMKDFTAAAKLLEPLCPIVPTADASPQSTPSNINANPEAAGSSAITGSGSPALRSAIARIYLQVGNLPMATQHFSIVASDPEVDENTKDMNEALLASAEGEWETATAALRRIVTRDPENYVAINNLSVTLLSQGELSESIQVLEAALASSPSSVVVAEPYLFNLSTLYELRSAEAMEKKKNLLIEVAKWSGDGLRTTCLKMPTN